MEGRKREAIAERFLTPAARALLAKEGYRLVIVARSEAELNRVSGVLSGRPVHKAGRRCARARREKHLNPSSPYKPLSIYPLL